MIYIFRVVLSRKGVKLPAIVMDMEAKNSKDAVNKILDLYTEELKVESATMVGSRKE